MAILNIPANYDFLQSIAKWALQKYPNYLSLANVTFFLPTRRCCREIKQIFLKISPNQAIILPKLKALSDIYPEDFLLSSNSSYQKINPLQYQLLLTQQIIQWNQKTQLFGKINLVKFLNIAQKIIFFLECLEKENCSIEKIYELEDDDLALSRQKIIDFVTNFIPFWRNFFAKKKFKTNIEIYNHNIEQIIAKINENNFQENPIIIAGSTGSFNATSSLIAQIIKFNDNYLILSALDRNNSDVPKSHPQHNINQLVKRLKIDIKNIHDIKYQDCKQRDDDFTKVTSQICLPPEKTYLWSEKNDNIKLQSLENITIIEAENQYQEAKIISQQIIDVLNNSQKNIALINNDQNFCQMVKLNLRRNGIIVDDSYNKNMADIAISKYWLLLLEIFNGDSFSHNLLNLLKNPLTKFLPISQKSFLIQKLEHRILRKIPGKKDLNDIIILIGQENNPELAELFGILQKIILPLWKLYQKNQVSCLEILEKSIFSLQQLVQNNNENCTIVNYQDFNEFIQELKGSLTTLDPILKISYEFSGNFFKSLTNIKKIDKKVEDFHRRVKIFSQLEARLLNHDVTIVSGLNEGEFTNAENQNSWIGRKICNQLGIFDAEQKNSMTFYDFCHYLGNKEVLLSYAKFKENLPTIKSNILFRLEIFAQIIGQKITKLPLSGKINNNTHPKSKRPFIHTPCPPKYSEGSQPTKLRIQPQEILRFTQDDRDVDKKTFTQKIKQRQSTIAPLKYLSITDISKWQRDPYYIYAKRILKLKKLAEIDRNPSFAEFGNFIHKVAEEFGKNFHKEDSLQQNLQQIKKLANQYFLEFFFKEENRILWQKKIDYILHHFVAYEMQLSQQVQEVLTEVNCNFAIKNTNISGKIDRINIFKDHIEIIDYKTGIIPQKGEVQIGLEPQLVVSLIAFINHFGEDKISNKKTSLFYHILKIKDIKEKKIQKEFFKKPEEIAELKQSAEIGLENLIELFDNNKEFISRPNLVIYQKNDYQHLER